MLIPIFFILVVLGLDDLYLIGPREALFPGQNVWCNIKYTVRY